MFLEQYFLRKRYFALELLFLFVWIYCMQNLLQTPYSFYVYAICVLVSTLLAIIRINTVSHAAMSAMRSRHNATMEKERLAHNADMQKERLAHNERLDAMLSQHRSAISDIYLKSV
jgi:hypothetical protein